MGRISARIHDFIRETGARCLRVFSILPALLSKLSAWQDPNNQKSLRLLLRELRRVICEIAPRKGKGSLRYGCPDPYQTGQLAQLFAFCYPLYGNHLTIAPDFEETVLETELQISGRARVFVLLRSLCSLYSDRNLRRIYRILTEGERKETNNVGTENRHETDR